MPTPKRDGGDLQTGSTVREVRPHGRRFGRQREQSGRAAPSRKISPIRPIGALGRGTSRGAGKFGSSSTELSEIDGQGWERLDHPHLIGP
jgi:hypothetical protein